MAHLYSSKHSQGLAPRGLGLQEGWAPQEAWLGVSVGYPLCVHLAYCVGMFKDVNAWL